MRPPTVQPAGRVIGQVYEATNAAAGNAVQVFDRYADGHLVAKGAVATGGKGAGASLHSQGGLVRDGRLLFVVNAGDKPVSTLAITGHGLVWRDTEASGGTLPASVTAHDGVAYVLNQGSSTISGFRYDRGRPAHTAGRVDPRSAHRPDRGDRRRRADLVPAQRKPPRRHRARDQRDRGLPGRTTGTPASDAAPPRPAPRRTGSTSTAAVTCWSRRRRVRPRRTGWAAGSRRESCGLGHPGGAVLAGDDPHRQVGLRDQRGQRLGLVVPSGYGRRAVPRRRGGREHRVGFGPTDATVSPDGATLSVRLGSGALATYAIHANGSLSSLGTAIGAAAIGSAGLASS